MQVFLGGIQDGFIISPENDDYDVMLHNNQDHFIYFMCKECKYINCYQSLYIWHKSGMQSCVHCSVINKPFLSKMTKMINK
jgi:hypothetical protein